MFWIVMKDPSSLGLGQESASGICFPQFQAVNRSLNSQGAYLVGQPSTWTLGAIPAICPTLYNTAGHQSLLHVCHSSLDQLGTDSFVLRLVVEIHFNRKKSTEKMFAGSKLRILKLPPDRAKHTRSLLLKHQLLLILGEGRAYIVYLLCTVSAHCEQTGHYSHDMLEANVTSYMWDLCSKDLCVL